MDDVDRGILRALKGNAREPYVEIAKRLHTSEGTIRARVKKLTDEGQIKQFTIRTAGSAVKAMIEVRIETNVNMTKVSEEIRSWEGVERVWEVTGEADILVMVDVASTAALNEVVDRIRQVSGTQSTRSRLILKEY